MRIETNGVYLRRFGSLDAGAFAFVMATGILSFAAAAEGLAVLSDALLAAGCLAWLVLAAAVSWHALHSRRARPRLQSFALVAATAVIGGRFAQSGLRPLGLALWIAALAFWLLLVVQRPTADGVRGGSLLIVVATESLAVLAALLAAQWTAAFLDAALAAWLLGLVLYLVVVAAVVTTLRHARRFEADLWIGMGALAITTLAGSEVLLHARELAVLGGARAILDAANLATWAAAAVLIVPLLFAELRTRRWRYDATRWSFVFPLGMFSAASRTLARADELSFPNGVALAFFVIALAAWSLVLLGLARRALSRANAAA